MDFLIIDLNRFYEINEIMTFEQVLAQMSEVLINEGYIKKEYNQDILNNLKENGPYFVLAPFIALPHAMSENVIEPCISVCKMKNPVLVCDKEVKLFIYLASNNKEIHMDLLMRLVNIMNTTELQEKLINCSFEKLKKIFTTII